ncbi:MAG: hypothetical protein N2053_02805 [Chitinispirillaceae bacterium]|nr:hypothetical protein [Chitinispirillaceae bacterium]
MIDDLKNRLIRASEVLKEYGAKEVFFFGSVAKISVDDNKSIELAVSGIAPEVFFSAMGRVAGILKRNCYLVDLDDIENSRVKQVKTQSKVDSGLFSRIKKEFELLYELIRKYQKLFDRIMRVEPTEIEKIALYGILQMYYSGIERIFLLIISNYDSGFKNAISNDAEILERVVMPSPSRSPVISKFLMEQLQPYLAFRMAFFQSFCYEIEWGKIRNLVLEAEEILLVLEAEINFFLSHNI